MSRFDYVLYDQQSQEIQSQLKEQFEKLVFLITGKLDSGRAQSLALTRIEEAYSWIGKAVRDDQLTRTGEVQLQEERSNS